MICDLHIQCICKEVVGSSCTLGAGGWVVVVDCISGSRSVSKGSVGLYGWFDFPLKERRKNLQPEHIHCNLSQTFLNRVSCLRKMLNHPTLDLQVPWNGNIAIIFQHQCTCYLIAWRAEKYKNTDWPRWQILFTVLRNVIEDFQQNLR